MNLGFYIGFKVQGVRVLMLLVFKFGVSGLGHFRVLRIWGLRISGLRDSSA